MTYNPLADPNYQAFLAQQAQQNSVPQTSFQPAQYAPQGQPAPAPLAQGTLDDFYNQRTASGAGLNTIFKQPGTSVTVTVARDLNNADVQQMTDFQTKQPKFYKDGRPMYQLVIPVLVQGHPDFPTGEATWYVKGKTKDELLRAMGAANAGTTVPQGGAVLTITYTRDIPQRGGLNPAKEMSITYAPPQGAQAPVQLPQDNAVTQNVDLGRTQPAHEVAPQQVQTAPVQAAQVPPSNVPQAAPAAVQGMPPGLSPEQQAQYLKLTGQG